MVLPSPRALARSARLARPPLGIVAVVAGLLATSAVQAGLGLWRPSTFVAPVIAGLLWAGHRRARFAGYIFFTVLAARGAIGWHWEPITLSAVALALMQTAAARRHCLPIPRKARDRIAAP
jgi:hypothetical protein